jgi:hypothetical protein
VLALSDKWAPVLVSSPETGMGYQVASVVLSDGRRYDGVTIVGGYITAVRGLTEIPFAESEIRQIVVNHGR